MIKFYADICTFGLVSSCCGNKLVPKLIGSCRNGFGPLHLPDDKPYYVSPASFRKHKLVLYGLYGNPILCKVVENKDMHACLEILSVI